MKKKVKTYSFDEIKDEFIGKRGTPKREEYEYELRMDIISELIKKIRKRRRLTQSQLGKLVGVQKAQISKLESGSGNVTIKTVFKVFSALRAPITFNVNPDKKRKKAA